MTPAKPPNCKTRSPLRPRSYLRWREAARRPAGRRLRRADQPEQVWATDSLLEFLKTLCVREAAKRVDPLAYK